MNSSPPQANKSLILSYRFLMGLATVGLLFLFVVYAVYTINLMQFPFDYDQGEGFELVDTILFSQGQLPYQDIETYPFYSSNYPPLFHIMAAPFVWFFGEAYWYGRLLGSLGTILAAFAIGYAVYRDGGKHGWVAILVGLAFLASNTIYHIAPLFRQHMTMVMFETIAVVILARSIPSQDRRGTTIGMLLLIAAGYTKQLAAITALAVFAWFFLRNPRRAILWGISFVAIGGIIFILLNIASEGQWWIHAIVANVNEFNRQQAIDLFKLWFQLHGFLVIPAIIYVLYELYFERLSLYSVWFVFALVLGGIGSGTWGAGDSYFATAIAAMCILSGLFASRALNRSWQFPDHYITRFFEPLIAPIGRLLSYSLVILIPLLFIGYTRAVWHMPTDGMVFQQVADVLNVQPNVRDDFFDSATYNVLGYATIGYLTTETDLQAGHRIAELIRNSEQPVMSEEAGFSIVAERDVITNPTQLLNVWRANLYDGGELLNLIQEQSFAYVIMRAQFYPQPILESVQEQYIVTETVTMNRFEYLILSPREAP